MSKRSKNDPSMLDESPDHRPDLRGWMVFLLIVSAGFLVAIPVSLWFGWGAVGRLTSTAGYALAIAGLLQLEVSGLFVSIPEEYSDVEKYPYGPPSHWTRGRVGDGSWGYHLWEILYRQPRTGFQMIVGGSALQALAAWV